MRVPILPKGLLLAPLLALLLAGCGNSSRTLLPTACSNPTLLADGADLTRYQPGAPHDLTALMFDARLAGLRGGCNPGRGDRSIELTLNVDFSVERGPAAGAPTVELPWFVAVIDNRTNRILSKQLFLDRLTFARNETRQTGTSEPVQISLPVSETRRAQNYRVLVSFELTPEELAENRRRGPR